MRNRLRNRQHARGRNRVCACDTPVTSVRPCTGPGKGHARIVGRRNARKPYETRTSDSFTTHVCLFLLTSSQTQETETRARPGCGETGGRAVEGYDQRWLGMQLGAGTLVSSRSVSMDSLLSTTTRLSVHSFLTTIPFDTVEQGASVLVLAKPPITKRPVSVVTRRSMPDQTRCNNPPA